MNPETIRPFRAQLNERDRPRVPLSLLRRAYRRAVDTWNDNLDEPETVRDYWPACVEMELFDADLLDPENAKYI